LRRIRELKAREAREGEALGREPESGAVQLMSIHASKGLEFPVIAIADMGRRKSGSFGSPYLLHDPVFGLVCRVRDENGDWQKPAGYVWGEWLNERMEEAENKRLFYVASTRAADLLILSGQVGKKNSWLAEVLDAWCIEVDGPEVETVDFDDFSIRVFRPIEPGIQKQAAVYSRWRPVTKGYIPDLVTTFPVHTHPQTTAMTHLFQLLGREENAPPFLQPALWSIERERDSNRAPSYLIGNIVHRVFAHWDCLTYSEGELLHLIENYARREGVFTQALVDTVQRSYQMAVNFRIHPIYEEIQNAKQRHQEVTVILSEEVGLLHGIIDLLYEDRSGTWHIIDWKTEWTPKSEIENNAQQYLLQMSAYAQAIQKKLQTRPQVSLCFLNPAVELYSFPNELTRNAWSQVES
jgi:ATP-dependent exoDNAse (exonuclease V) beta subunit